MHPWLLARRHPVAVVARADHEVGQDAAVPGDAAAQAHCARGGRSVGSGGGGRLRLHGGEGGQGVGAVLLLPGQVLQGGGLLLLYKNKADQDQIRSVKKNHQSDKIGLRSSKYPAEKAS